VSIGAFFSLTAPASRKECAWSSSVLGIVIVVIVGIVIVVIVYVVRISELCLLSFGLRGKFCQGEVQTILNFRREIRFRLGVEIE